MNDLEKQLPELDFDAIMREFGVADPLPTEEEDIRIAPEDTVTEVLPAEEYAPEEQLTEAPAPVTESTIRLDDISHVVGQAVNFEPVDEDDEDAPAPELEPEPFSKEWEPKYDEPIGEYIPPQPIIFRPRSRLKELRRDLVAGPEKRYYDLSEQGLGKLQAAMFVNFLVLLLCAGSTALYALGMVQESRMRLLVFGQILAMLVSALLGCYQVMAGISDIFRLRFSLNSLLVFTFIACCADGVLCLQELRVPCCAAFSLSVGMSLWNAYQKRSTEMGQMDTMRKATRLDGIVKIPDFYEGRPGFLQRDAEVADFMDTYDRPSGPEKVLCVYAVIALLAGIGIGIVAGRLHGLSMGVQICAASLLVAVPASSFITLSRPAAILEQRLHKLGAVLCGWQGVKGMSSRVSYPLSDDDLFPAGSAKLNGVKFYGDRDPDDVVAYATALISASGGGLSPLFSQLLDSRNGRHYQVENLQYYNGGIGGEVCGEPVLVGVLSFLQDMGVDMPKGTKVNQAVYAAVDGRLCGVFAISYSKSRSSAAGLSTLCSYRGLTPVLTCRDFMLTEGFLRGKFGINTRRIAFPDRQLRNEMAAKEAGEDDTVLAITTKDGLAPRAFAVTGARALRTASITGLVIHMLGGMLGLAIMGALAYLGTAELLTPVNMLLYQLVWMIPGLLITEWTRAI